MRRRIAEWALRHISLTPGLTFRYRGFIWVLDSLHLDQHIAQGARLEVKFKQPIEYLKFTDDYPDF